jgi:hypothetical protein
MAEILYINKHHFITIQKLQSGEHNEWAKTSIKTSYIVQPTIERFMNEILMYYHKSSKTLEHCNKD